MYDKYKDYCCLFREIFVLFLQGYGYTEYKLRIFRYNVQYVDQQVNIKLEQIVRGPSNWTNVKLD